MKRILLHTAIAATVACCNVQMTDASSPRLEGKKASKSNRGSIRRPVGGSQSKGKDSRGSDGASKTSGRSRGSRGKSYQKSPSVVSYETFREDEDRSQTVNTYFAATALASNTRTIGMDPSVRNIDNPSEANEVVQPRANTGDMGFRFSKTECDMEKDGIFPLTADDFPLDGGKAEYLRLYCDAWSVLDDDDYELHGIDVQGVYIDNFLGWPTHCGEDGFWEEFEEVVNVQIQRRAGVPFSEIYDMPMPRIWEGHSTDQIAENVHNEYPVKHQSDHLKYIWHDKAHLDYRITPFRSHRDFIGYEVRLAEILTWGVSNVSAINFKVKWIVGRARPEEIAWKIATDHLTNENDQVPTHIIDKVKSMDLTSQEEFTKYPEGAPSHPAWPAMHSAGSAIHIWLPVMMKLNWEQYCETLRVDFLVSYARTVAGVHYTGDNIAGLDLGQRIIADELPHHLSEKYGGDYEAIKRKVDAFRFSWADFDAATCEFSGDSTGMRNKLMSLGYIEPS